MTSPEQRPFEFAVPEDYEQRIEDARAALDVVPRNENWENAQRVLADPPSREAVEAAQREAAQAMARLAEFQAARHTGYDPDQTTKVVIDASGDLAELEFGVDAVRLGNHGLADAVLHAWAAAETLRSEHATAFAGNASGGTDAADAGLRILRAIDTAIDARAHERFERTTEDGLCKIAVNLRGVLVEVVCLKNNILNLTDRHTLAEQITAAVTAAQAAASGALGQISASHYAELG